ncbi:hypothetical protein J2X20_003133 [Pelomonas saccharophila]|uniref:DUF4476 domain-containing protein n=1 Tax=Roseateles saccharophilus TaxID=304 RepID=A0ABU1YNP0_ROSSA|nr:hypothetical protein [Roseateles saccharophilus]MDR7270475.1 hypothetical protein [Roseateles saccharophilus]
MKFQATALSAVSAALALFAQASFAADPTAQLTGLVRIVKSDGQTVIAQAAPMLVTANGTAMSAMPQITVSEKDAFISSLGRCAFNFKYDEVSATAIATSTNRIYSNDTLIAQNTQIALTPKVVKTIWTQPYLFAGANNVKVVVNVDGVPSTGWVRINVTGTCGKPTTAPAPAPVAAPPAPAPSPAPAPVTYIQPGSGDWNNLNNAWGYSNYAVTQLKGKGYAKYDALVKLNASLTAAINAKKISTGEYASLMAAWNALLADPAFKAAMAAIVPTPGQK